MNFTRVMVVAGTVEEFHEFLRQKTSISTVYTFVDGTYKFNGISKDDLKGVFIGTWYNRSDIHDIVAAISVIKGGLPMEVVDKLHEMSLQKVAPPTTNSKWPTTNTQGFIATPIPISNGGTITANEYWVKQGFLPGQNKTNLEVYDEVFKKLNALSIDPNEVKDYINDTINNQTK